MIQLEVKWDLRWALGYVWREQRLVLSVKECHLILPRDIHLAYGNSFVTPSGFNFLSVKWCSFFKKIVQGFHVEFNLLFQLQLVSVCLLIFLPTTYWRQIPIPEISISRSWIQYTFIMLALSLLPLS